MTSIKLQKICDLKAVDIHIIPEYHCHMNKSPKNSNLLLSNQPDTFIHLKEKTFAEYNIIYHINDGYVLKRISDIYCEHQLLFQKFDNKIQQLNLMRVDSIFPIILAKVATQTLLKKVSSFQDYIDLNKFLIIIDPQTDKIYFRNKFIEFIHYLLFTNIASGNICKGEEDCNKVYYQKSKSSEIEYFSIFKQHELQKLMLEKMRLQINLKNSSISKNEAILFLKIFIP